MLDLVSVIREKVFRRPKLSQEIAGEELSEKQTTKLGYFLLFCMFSAIIVSAQWTLDIIKNLVDRPKNVPYCVVNMISAFEKDNYTNYSRNNYKCNLVSTNPEFNLQKEFDSLSTPYNQIISYNEKIRNLESDISNIDYNNRNKQNDYNTSLTERIANENSGLYDTKIIQNDIKNNNSKKSNLYISINKYKKEINNIKSSYKQELISFKEKVEKAKSDYRISYLFYKFYIALLSFIFIITIFVILYKIYVKQKLKNSPHTIIFSIATFAYGLVFLEIAFMFMWDIIPHQFLYFLSNLFSIFTPFIYIVQFLWPVLIITIFGFLVYKIQKRLYSTSNVLKRFISDKKCPNCGNRVDFTKPFCSLCSHEIHIHCNYCHELTLKGMPYCSNCGGKLPEKDIITNDNNNLFDDTFNKILKDIKIENYKGVKLIPNEGKTFTSSRENIIKIVIFMTNKLEKTEFNPNEFSPYLKEIIKHIKKDNIKESELNRILGKIKSWVELGGKVILLKK